MDDALVILSDVDRLPAIETAARVRQRYGERVLVVAAETAPRLLGLAGATVFLPGTAGAEPPPHASEIERMGVEAWNARVASAGKSRPGDGLSWDAPGFEAP